MTISRCGAALAVILGLVWLLGSAAQETSAEEGLLARWQLTADHFKDDAFQPLAGTLTATKVGALPFGKDKPQALRFDGDSKKQQRLRVTDDLKQAKLPSAALTVEAWVKVELLQQWGGIVGVFQDNGPYEKGWMLGFNEHGQFLFGVAAATRKNMTYLPSKTTFALDSWAHVVGTYDGKEQKLYVDGQLAAVAREQSGAIAYPPKACFSIGAYKDDDEHYTLHGEIESVSVWSRALAAGEIQQRYTSRKQRFPELPVIPQQVVVDWPTYMRDNGRTGLSDTVLETPLALQWVYKAALPPAPAWPAPAEHDYWHKKYNLEPRVVYDRAYHVVTVGERLYFGSSADDRVRCLSTRDGTELWSVAAEGPVRLAPTVAGERVLFGSDDGCVYCVAAADGKLLWKTRVSPEDRRIAGNERVISTWPIRTGVLVQDKLAYCCAGFYPDEGVYQAALEIETGKLAARQKIDIAAQGYMEARNGKLFLATGNNPTGTFVNTLLYRGKGVAKELTKLPKEYPFTMIGAGKTRFAGGASKVAALAAADGQLLWSAEVAGNVYGLAAARGRLYVSTDQGYIYCYAPGAPGRPQPVGNMPSSPYPDKETQQHFVETAQKVLKDAAVAKGYALVLDSTDGFLAYELARQSSLRVICAAPDAASAQRIRARLAGVPGSERVSVQVLPDANKLPYAPYLFNLVVRDGAAQRPFPLEAEAKRVLRPYGGVGIWYLADGVAYRRPALAKVGEWTHQYAEPGNTACSQDPQVQGPMQLLWFGPPGPRPMIDRHHRTAAPLFKSGRLFIPGNDRIFAVDAYNGTPLWDVELKDSRRIAVYRDCSQLAVSADMLYIAAADKCHAYDPATGKKLHEMQVPPAADGAKREWGYLAVVDDLVYGSAAQQGATRREQSYAATIEASFWDSRPLPCSQSVFARDRRQGEPRWTYHATKGLIINSTLTIGGDCIYFVESGNAATFKSANGRVTLVELLSKGAEIVALDRKTGQERWRKTHPFLAVEHVLFLCHAQERVVVVGSRNSGKNKKKDSPLYDVLVLAAGTGELVWKHTQRQNTVINGDHGEQDHHPVVIGDKLYCEPFAYNLHTGEPLKDFRWNPKNRHGCGTISASASTMFFRQSNPTMFDLVKNEYSKVTTCSRPGCWINIIPAGGLLLIPEASSGCTCNYAVQTSMAFVPVQAARE